MDGSCFPKDTAEFFATSKKYNAELSIVKAAMDSNDNMFKFVVNKVQNRLKSLNGKKIGILGLTFKPNTDDARKTQASAIIQQFLEFGASVKVHDPQGMEMFKELNPLDVEYCKNGEDVAQNADAVILLTHWDEYKQLDWNKVYKSMKNPYILDTRNFLSQIELESIGFKYEGLGIGV